MFLLEAKRDRIRLLVSDRAMKFEVKMSRMERNSLRGECWRFLEKGEMQSKEDIKVLEFYESRG